MRAPLEMEEEVCGVEYGKNRHWLARGAVGDSWGSAYVDMSSGMLRAATVVDEGENRGIVDFVERVGRAVAQMGVC